MLTESTVRGLVALHISTDKLLIERCPVCAKNYTPHREPLMPTPLPDFPWQKVAMDLFTSKESCYLVIVDYFSRYPEVIKLRTTTSAGIIEAVKAVFSRHGIPETVISDNGPQFSSKEFAKFASQYSFQHRTSSPHFPQSNSLVERTVQTVKNILKQSSDPYLAILVYRSTPFPWCNLSPARLLMGRQLRTTLPQAPDHMKPEWPYLEKLHAEDMDFKLRQKANFDKRHQVRPLSVIADRTDVWISTDRADLVPGVIVKKSAAPRSYLIDTESGALR